MNAQLTHMLARKRAAERRRLTVTDPLPFQVTATATSPAVTIQSAPPPPPPPTPALPALDITPRMFTPAGRRVGGWRQSSSRVSYRLLATPTINGIAGQQQPTTFEITC